MSSCQSIQAQNDSFNALVRFQNILMVNENRPITLYFACCQCCSLCTLDACWAINIIDTMRTLSVIFKPNLIKTIDYLECQF